MSVVLKPENIAQLVFFIRGERVMLDAELARLYGVTTGNLNKAVKRNQARFPEDFMFQLTRKETESLIFQFGRSKGWGGRRHRPYAFTEQGVAMLSSVFSIANAPCRSTSPSCVPLCDCARCSSQTQNSPGSLPR